MRAPSKSRPDDTSAVALTQSASKWVYSRWQLTSIAKLGVSA